MTIKPMLALAYFSTEGIVFILFTNAADTQNKRFLLHKRKPTPTIPSQARAITKTQILTKITHGKFVAATEVLFTN